MATRNEKIHGIIHMASVSAAAVGAGLAQVPGADAPVLTSIQIAMITLIGEVHDKKITQQAAIALLATFAATVGGRTISQALVGWIPGYGNTLNAITAATLTEGIGWAADIYFAKSEDEAA